jgi:hypothetical protein
LPNETEHLITLVRTALDEFESVPLSASVRRTLRIAQLKGDATQAWFCRLDLRPTGGGSKALQRGEIVSLWPEADYPTMAKTHNALLEEWMLERQIANPTPAILAGLSDGSTSAIVGGSVDEVEAALKLREGPWREELADLSYRNDLDQRAMADRAVLDRVRQRIYFYLCRCETELALGGIAANVFDRHRQRVDALLAVVAPDVLEQMTAAHRRAVEGDREARTHALTSCRRALKAVADLVFPAQAEAFVGKDGTERLVGEDQYKNRLLAFLEGAAHQTAADVVTSTLEDFVKRIDALNSLDGKGVHAEVEQQEVDLCVTQTYLLAGEVLAIHAGQQQAV